MRKQRRRVFEITVRGILGEHWEDYFLGVTLRESAEGGHTVLVGDLDQAALHGVLQGLADFGVPLVSVTEVELFDEPEPEPSHATSGRKEKVQ